ncbi:M35 family metallopeptidase [Mycobacterium sp. 4D054]|uniref:M35 family metallopeptidase n=1 Tax=unclassified Mycobacterium TaxID=2642494 RepID=UPI0021B3A4D5|nr:M35 family metallopeptidase [Mycobacterium sp. SMC-8]UXA14054.1 M35 family metallopeptidase [Mycobacterium sp. SMC-8]
MYLSDQPVPAGMQKLVHRRKAGRVAAGMAGVSAEDELLGAPIFDFPACAPCPLPTAEQCLTALRQAIVRAIRLANNAADKVDASISVAPAARGADAVRTARIFRSFFGHDPSRPVPWAGNEASGVSVAKRLRAVARELDGGRRITFECRPAVAGCADNDLTCCTPCDNAWVHANVGRNTVVLCPMFWAATRDIRAGIIIHEMLHLLYGHLRDVGEGRIRNACYEAFALRLAGITPDPFDVCNCRATPCPAAVC